MDIPGLMSLNGGRGRGVGICSIRSLLGGQYI